MAAQQTQPGTLSTPCTCASGPKTRRCAACRSRDCSYEAHLKRGNALLHQGAFVDACLSLRQAIALRPQDPQAINNLGVALERLGRPEAAATCYRQALALDPRHAPAHSNLGARLHAQGHTTDAVTSLEHAVACDPALADAWSNLSAAQRSLGRTSDAEQSARRALKLQPGDVEAQLNLGNALKDQGRLEPAAQRYQQATRLAPDDPRPWNNLGETRRDQGRIPEAAECYQRALALHPQFAAARSNLIYLHGFAHDLEPAQELQLARQWEHSMVPAADREAARRAAPATSGVFPATPRTGRKLRLGIVSAELGTHAVAEFLQPFLEQLDRERFHLTLFPTQGRHCPRAQQILGLADQLIPINERSDAAAVERIRASAIDVLLDTSGHTAGNRLGVSARRAAPVQCTWIGYWGTTGLTEMDWFLTDTTAPSGAEAGFSERIWRLPRHALCYRGDASLPIDWQPDPSGAIRLGSFNKFAKIREQTLALWAPALHALPNARLILEDRGTDESESHARIRQGFAAHGIAPERIEFLPFVPGHERHMLLYNSIDIALDTVPFNSGTTAFDALWMGVPLITLKGEWLGGRIAGEVLRSLGRPEWIAPDPAAFIAIVRDLAHDLPLQRRIRQTQRDHMLVSPPGDAVSLTRAVEDAVCAMYDQWLGDRPRAPHHVP